MLGTVIHRLASVASTNDVARGLARSGAAHGTAVVAEEQMRGRGTKGRAWHSPPGLGLYASFIVRFDDPGGLAGSFPLLPLAAGLAAAEAVLESSGVEARLKWPNDLVRERKKLGGILTEGVLRPGAPGYAVVGIGVNVNQGEEDFPAGLREVATSLRLVSGRAQDLEALLRALCRSLDCWYNSLIRGEGDSVVRGCLERMAFSPGQRVRVTMARGEADGLFRGLGPDGRLLLDGAGGAVSFSAEEIEALEWE
jgi:BirA family transcriptional regulator, biotin operon repressor / biotin---[acetyl-CoA-carboxylase] ligase